MKHLEELSMTEMYTAYLRWETIRKFTPRDFSIAWERAIKGDYYFDQIIDSWPALPSKTI